MASRILGFGDVVGLMKDFEAVVDKDRAELDAKRMLEGRFTLHDFLEQIKMIQKMGPLQDIFEKLPFFGDSMPEGVKLDDRELKRVEAIVRSMTHAERMTPELFREKGRIARVAKGSGRTEKDVAELLERFNMMKQMMGGLGKQAGMLSRIPGLKQLASARRLNELVRTGGFEGNPMMGNLADQLLEAQVAGADPMAGLFGPGGMLGGPGKGVPRALSDAEKKKKQQLRKAQKQARKKSRK
jgi:signal recognition particle subunit SRP54